MTALPGMTIPPDQAQRLQASSDMLRQGRREEAIALLRSLVRDAPKLAPAQRLLGVGLSDVGDLMGAEVAFRAAIAADPSMILAYVGLGETLRMLDRGTEAIELLAPLVTPQTTDLNLLTYFGFALQSVGRWDEALVWLDQAVKTSSFSAVAEHNLASALADLSRPADAEAAARRAFAKGLDAPETWLVLARTLEAQDRPEEAEAAYMEALRARPGYSDVIGDLSKRVWVRTGDARAAEAVLDEALARDRSNPALFVHKAKLKEFAGDPAGAAEALDRALQLSADPMLHVAVAQLAVGSDPETAMYHAQRAFALRPDNYAVIAALCKARLALGHADEAVALAEILTERQPWDQYALALLATAWRLRGDPRYREIYDYEHWVRSFELSPPPGWSSLPAYLADLEAELEPLHPFRGHPVGQSVRHGSQTRADLKNARTPALKAFTQAIDAPIRAYMTAIGEGSDPLRRRKTGEYRLDGVWSVRLRPGGFHVDHVHHRGWLSSAFYVSLPEAVESGREGWLKFGEPGVPTAPVLGSERFERPVPGKLVLFPSYMWHGTVGFSGDQKRLSIAFDVVPA
ncbi:MAG TPA: tetratricopeptide repeat protein [Caulobacteraceae bacterium]|jgi:tetratricopeptide (TPR) repeat protein|nr:tetratricopeptide repeat protein [Caulobacteraceae bacterium]